MDRAFKLPLTSGYTDPDDFIEDLLETDQSAQEAKVAAEAAQAAAEADAGAGMPHGLRDDPKGIYAIDPPEPLSVESALSLPRARITVVAYRSRAPPRFLAA